MATRTLLSPAQRAVLFDPPYDLPAIEGLYTLGPADLAETARRRRASNRLGFAVQLCYLRHPGRPLEPGEVPPPLVLQLLAHQLGCEPGTFAEYAGRETTLREHRAEIEASFGLRGFERGDRPAMLAVAIDAAASTDRGEVIVEAMTRRLRETRIVLPAASTLERIALVARAQARRQAFAGLIRDLGPDQVWGLEDLLSAGAAPGRTALAWIREWPEAPSASNLKAVLERLAHVRRIGLEPDRGRRIYRARYGVIAREAAIMSAQHLSRLGRVLIGARAGAGDALELVGARVGWAALEGSVRDAEDLTRAGEDGLDEVVERYAAVRRFAPAFLAGFAFRASRRTILF